MDAKSVVVSVIERAWSCGELQLLDQLVGESYTRKVPGGVVNGAAEFKERISAAREAFRGFRCQVDNIFEENGTGVVLWTASGTNSGTVMGRPPTGRHVEWSGMTWFRVEDGRLIEEWELYDQLDMFTKLGIIT